MALLLILLKAKCELDDLLRVFLIVMMFIGCSNGNKNQIQVHNSIHELSVNKESDGYTNKPSKSSGYGLRYILQNQWGVGF